MRGDPAKEHIIGREEIDSADLPRAGLCVFCPMGTVGPPHAAVAGLGPRCRAGGQWLILDVASSTAAAPEPRRVVPLADANRRHCEPRYAREVGVLLYMLNSYVGLCVQFCITPPRCYCTVLKVPTRAPGALSARDHTVCTVAPLHDDRIET